MKFACVVFLMALAITLAKQCPNRRTNSKLICYYSDVKDINTCMCTHIILPANSDAQTINSVQEKFKGGHVLLTATELNEDLVNLLKNTKLDGLEINLKKLDDKNDVPDFISTVKSKLGSDMLFAVSIPSKAEHLAKFYDLKALTKHADLFILQTAFLGASQNVTFHPSRLSGLWDMQNIDSVVDLVTGMGAPLSKLVITAPVQAFQFTLQDETYTAPGSPALEIKSLTRQQLCNTMNRGSNWTLERDEDQAGPYIFRKNMWIAFDDATSMDIKAKYTRVRGLAGLALKDLTQDGGEKCGGTLLEVAYNGLSKQSRAPRGAVLQSLEREILETPSRPLDTIQISPYRISRVIDVEGNVHSIRQDTRTEFECARQGYYVHPRSCGRFYRCVKFDQLADDFSVFEFDCPAGLSFDSKVEVCVWPGSLSYSSACSGSSEIAPVPRTRFVCPQIEGYYADPENCRWFFACLDHGKSPLSAYEFRCPFGLVFDESRLVCEWPWAVPKCGSGSAAGFEYGSHASLGGARLDTYNGLGALGVVGLGGLSGTLIQPQAKVYTNAVNGAIGGQGQLHANLGYTQTLPGTGFKQGIFASSQIGSSGISGDSFSSSHGKNSGAGLASFEKSVGNIESSLSSGGISPGAIFNQYNHGLPAGPAYSNEGVILQQQTLGVLENHRGFLHSKHGQAQEIVGAVNGASYQTNIDYGSGLSNGVNLIGSNIAGKTGTKTASFINHGITQQQRIPSSGLSISDYHQTPFGQSFAAIHTNDRGQGAIHSIVPVEKIHIVGGFSAVGTGGKANIELGQNDVNINNIPQVGHAPPSSTFSIVLPSPVPSVAAAPVPVVKSDSNAYEDGVVANVPELQYKIVTPSASNVYFESNFKDNTDYSLSRGVFGLANISQNYVHYASSTPAPIALSTISYDYSTPVSSFRQASVVEPLVRFNQQHVVHQGYSYPKPATIFEEHAIQAVTPATVSYATPRTTKVVQPAVVSRFSFNNAQKSVVLQPVVSVTPVVQAGEHKITHLNNVQPIITPTVSIVQQQAQPAIVSSYNFQNIAKNKLGIGRIPVIHSNEPAIVSSYSFQNSFGAKHNYDNQKTGTVFGEKSYYSVQPAATLVDVGHDVSSNVRKTSLSGTTFNQYNQGSTYNNQAGVLKQQTSGFFNNHGGYSATKYHQEQGVVGGIHGASYQTNIDYGQDIPAVVSSFSINSAQTPIVSVTPVVPIVEQRRVVPQVVSVTPTVPIPVHNVHSEFESNRYNYHNQNSFKDEGYQYPKPVVAFNDVQPAVVSSFSIHNAEKSLPVITVNPTIHTIQQKIQPAIVSSYNFQNVGHNGYQNSNAAFSIDTNSAIGLAQTGPIEEQRIHTIQPAVTSGFSFQNLTRSENYGYFKQPVLHQSAVSVTPVTTIVKETLKQQPAVISSYNYQNVLNNRGYQTAPVISVTETVPIIEHRVKPLQPTIISSYSFQNEANTEGYKYTKQTIPLQSLQPIASVTPTVDIIQNNPQPAVVSSYSFQNLANNDYKFSKQAVPLQPAVSVTPTVPVVQNNPQPAVVSSYSFHNLPNDYKFSKQAVPLQPVVSVTPTVPIIQNNPQPAVVSSYSFSNLGNNDYKFSKQAVPLQPVVSVTPTVPIIQNNPQPAVVSSYSFSNLANNDYKFSKQAVPLQPVVRVTPTVPIVQNNPQPAVVSSYSFQNLANNDYKFAKKAVPLQPFVSVTPTVPVIQNNPQPAIVSSYSFHNLANNDYKFAKQAVPLQPVVSVTPTIPIIENKVKLVQPVVVSSYNYQVSNIGGYSKQAIPVHPIQPVENVPLISHKNVYSVQPSIVANYDFQNSAKSENLDYSKQILKSVQPVAPTVSTINIPVQPISTYSFNNIAKSTSPTLVSSFNINSFEKNDFSQGYEYRKPSIAFEEGPAQPIGPQVSVTPIVPLIGTPTQSSSVFNYGYKNAEAIRNGGYYSVNNGITPIQPQGFSYSTPLPGFGEKSRKSFTLVAPQPTRPSIFSVNTPVVPVIRQGIETVAPVIVSRISQPKQNEKLLISNGNFGQKISVSTTQRPIIIEDTIISKQEITIKHPQSAVNVQDYANRKPVEEVPFVAKKAYVTGQQQNQGGYNYPKPSIRFEEGPSIPASRVATKYEPVSVPVTSRGKVSFTTPTYVNDYYYTTPKPNIYISTPVPFTTLRSRSRINLNGQNSIRYTSTPKPSYTSTIATVLAAKAQPLGQFDYYNSRLYSTVVPTFSSTDNTQFGRKYSDSSIDNQYYFKTSTPHSTYVSSSTQNNQDGSIVVSTAKQQTYLPAKIDNGEYVITSKQSVPIPIRIKAVIKPKTYIRVNDFHPLLPAKLGAQCTCTSKTLTLRKNPSAVIPSAYDATNDDGYFVKPNNNQQLYNLNTPQQNGEAVLEDYVYEPRKVIEVSPSPSVIIKSTTNTILPAPAPAFTVRKRVRIGQVTTPTTLYSSATRFAQVTQAPQLFIKKSFTPVVSVYNEEVSQPSQPVNVVDNGLNLAKATIKETYSAKSFDRYGPGGWRSRQETLQGTIDCQRAGLFRHPEQCNKFYTCRWDCTKKRFTLHVFNCPVHLTFDSNLGACNWPSQGPACAGNTLLPNE